jgi:hypothetical protein
MMIEPAVLMQFAWLLQLCGQSMKRVLETLRGPIGLQH